MPPWLEAFREKVGHRKLLPDFIAAFDERRRTPLERVGDVCIFSSVEGSARINQPDGRLWAGVAMESASLTRSRFGGKASPARYTELCLYSDKQTHLEHVSVWLAVLARASEWLADVIGSKCRGLLNLT